MNFVYLKFLFCFSVYVERNKENEFRQTKIICICIYIEETKLLNGKRKVVEHHQFHCLLRHISLTLLSSQPSTSNTDFRLYS